MARPVACRLSFVRAIAVLWLGASPTVSISGDCLAADTPATAWIAVV